MESSYTESSMLIVDAANVVGSRPDGWWRDRRGATERLRDELEARRNEVVDEDARTVLVVEGAARGVASGPSVEVIAATGSGDDTIVDVVARHPDVRRVVVTADRELRSRVTALGAEVIGPRTVLR